MDPARVPGSQNVGRDIFRDDAAGTDGRAGTDGYASIDDSIAAYPDIVAYGNGMCRFDSLTATFRIERVGCRVKLDVRAQKYIIADPDFGAIKKHAIGVGVKMMSEIDVVAVVAMKGRHEFQIVRTASKKRFQNIQFFLFCDTPREL